MRKGVKAAIISAAAILVVIGIVIGILSFVGKQSDPVAVVPVSYHFTYYDGTVYYNGMVTAENLQSVSLSDTQTVTEIMVQEGQTVKKGDALLRFDTTLSDIQLERQKLTVEKGKLSLEQAQKELKRINNMVPYSPPPAPVPEPDPGPLTPVSELPYVRGGDGSEEKPVHFVWSQELTYDETFLSRYLGENGEAWLAFELREENSLDGALLQMWGLHVQKQTDEQTQTSRFVYRFFQPEELPDGDSDDPIDEPWVDHSSGYTASEIAQMRAEKEKEIRDLDLEIRMAQVEYERMLKEMENGIITANVDGVVTRLVDAETALMEGGPMMIVSGGGCYYVNVSLSEFDREKYPVGTEVKIRSWMSSTDTVGKIDLISDTPVQDWYNGSGNPNTTLYGARVAVPAEAMLIENDYVQVIIGEEQTGGTFCLENRYIRKEGGRAYVFLRGADDKLEKRYVETGAVIWDNFTVVEGGVTEEDWIAFPYGKDVRQGAETFEDNTTPKYY